jgi:hypothetical protein
MSAARFSSFAAAATSGFFSAAANPRLGAAFATRTRATPTLPAARFGNAFFALS